VYAAMLAFSATRGAWTVENVAKTINSVLLSPGLGFQRHPLLAFHYNGELGFAYDSPDADGYVGIGVPTVNDATAILGFVSGTQGLSNSRNLYVDGYEIRSISKLLDAYGQITAADTITFPLRTRSRLACDQDIWPECRCTKLVHMPQPMSRSRSCVRQCERT